MGHDGKIVDVSKIVVLPHITAAMAFRGAMTVQQGIAGACFVAKGVDEILEHMHRALPVVIDLARQAMERAGVRDPWAEEISEFILAGWSMSRGQIIGRRWNQVEPGGPFLQERINGIYYGPWDQSLEALPSPSSPAAMAVVARAQCGLLNEKAEPRHRAGGRLIVAEVTRDRISIETTCELQ
jgi:hypothetical protein